MFDRRAALALLLVFTVGLGACASKTQTTKSSRQQSSGIDAPEWFYSPPSEEGMLIVASTAYSSRLSLALNKARLKGKRELAGSIQSTLQGQRERYVEEMGNTSDEKETRVREQYQDLIREMVDVELSGVKLREKIIKKEDSGYRAYVLLELSMEDFRNSLSDKEELKTRFNAKGFEEDMEQNLKEMHKNR